ncbi:DUF1611 domain-containing protein [Halonatronum saccharophilum]|uniref:DUF1611 domain-containing protein n=1 Tax=Halonatronum saccharophilum TaxID=150060 RepID=UPI0004827B74|nr:DUF1611 domain-containing protein [Halonatronum saccharophilum]
MKKVAFYPFNKITRGLIKFSDLLDFEIASVVDFGFYKEEGFREGDEYFEDICITASLTKALADVDTLILNGEGVSMEGMKDFYATGGLKEKWKELIKFADQKGIEIINIHKVEDEELRMWLQEKDIAINNYDKSREYIQKYITEAEKLDVADKITKIGIYATRGCIGKFTTQMTLLRSLKEANEKVGAIITEPTSYLFNQYDGDYLRLNVKGHPLDAIQYMSATAKYAEKDGKEYLLFSDQQSLTGNVETLNMVLYKVGMLKEFNPDIILLIVGYDDDDVIEECLNVLQVYSDTKKPLALMLPDCVQVKYGQYKKKSPKEIEERKKELKEKFAIENIELIKDIDNIRDLITNQ